MQKQFNTFNQEFTVRVLVVPMKVGRITELLADNKYPFTSNFSLRVGAYSMVVISKGVKRFATLHQLLKNEEII